MNWNIFADCRNDIQPIPALLSVPCMPLDFLKPLKLEGERYKRLVYVRKQDPAAYAFLVEATRNLQ